MSRNKYAVARRSIWYILRTLVMTLAIIAFCYGVFVMGMYVSNIYILTTEGMEKRAECILTDTSIYDLTEYFTEDFVQSDFALYQGLYDGFTVSTFDYRLSIENFYVLPWNSHATMQVVESIATMAASPNTTNEDGTTPPLPEWPASRYVISFSRVGSRWYISGLTLLDLNPEIEPKPTPDYSQLEGNG